VIAYGSGEVKKAGFVNFSLSRGGEFYSPQYRSVMVVRIVLYRYGSGPILLVVLVSLLLVFCLSCFGCCRRQPLPIKCGCDKKKKRSGQ